MKTENRIKLKANLFVLVNNVSTGFNNMVGRVMALQVLSHEESITGRGLTYLSHFIKKNIFNFIISS